MDRAYNAPPQPWDEKCIKIGSIKMRWWLFLEQCMQDEAFFLHNQPEAERPQFSEIIIGVKKNIVVAEAKVVVL